MEKTYHLLQKNLWNIRPHIVKEKPARCQHVTGWTSDREDFWAQAVEILVFASPTGSMLTSSGFPSLNWGIFYKFL